MVVVDAGTLTSSLGGVIAVAFLQELRMEMLAMSPGRNSSTPQCHRIRKDNKKRSVKFSANGGKRRTRFVQI